MKGLLFLCLLTCFVLPLKAQEEFSYVDNKARYIPAAEAISTTSIANYILSNYKTEGERLRAIYAWVTANIEYSTDSMYRINWGGDPEARITVALRRRKGVCENFAAIFNDIALRAGLRSQVVSGYVKQSGSVNRSGHSWCVVYFDNEWLFCDPTWDINFRERTNYFLIKPGQFVESHMPFDPLWQMLPYTLSNQEFVYGSGSSKKIYFNYEDSVKDFMQLNELQQLEASARRIRQAGVFNELLKNRLAFIQMKIGIIYEDKDMNLYNSAVSDLNSASTVFNNFVNYRNDHFLPAKTDAAISALLDPIEGILSSAWIKLDKIGKSVENYQYDTGALKDRLNALATKVQRQKDFLQRYFAVEKTEREKLFYK